MTLTIFPIVRFFPKSHYGPKFKHLAAMQKSMTAMTFI